MKVVMIGADRSVKGGVSAMVNNLYRAGLDREVELTYIGTMKDGSSLKKALTAVWALVRFVASMPGTDLVHVNMAADASCLRKMYFMKVARFFHKKIIIQEHGGDFKGFYYERCSKRRQEKIKKALNRAELFLVLSDGWRDFFSKLVEPSKIRILENGVLIPESEKSDYSSHSVLFLGRLCREKGIGELLEAAPAIRREVADFRLILGGFWEKGNEALRNRAEELSGFVSCPGWVGEKERERLFETCSLFVLPTWFEGQPVSLLEAMGAGLCVAASAVGGIPQIVLEESERTTEYGAVQNGFLLKPKDSKELAHSIVFLLKDEALRRQMGSCARNRVRERYDIRVNRDRLVAFYKEALGREE